jgi:hypothetical protein
MSFLENNNIIILILLRILIKARRLYLTFNKVFKELLYNYYNIKENLK